MSCLFLSLPQEIFDQIVEYVISTTCNPPTSPDATANRKELFDIEYLANLAKRRSILYDPESPRQNYLSLLLTDRETSQRTQATISRVKSTKRPNYHLDIMVQSGMSLYPTWRSVPWLTNRIGTLHADVRLFGPIMGRRQYRRQFGDGGRRGVHWHFYGLLERFVERGPVGETTCTIDRDMVIETLILDFSADTTLVIPTDESEVAGMEETFKPEEMCRWIYQEFLDLLYMGYHHARYGKLLYHSIGRVRMLVDGQPFQDINLTTLLEKLEYRARDEWRREKGVPAFQSWKKATMERQVALGFKGESND